MSFGTNLKTLLYERRMTQKELAEQLNLSPSTIGSYAQDARQPDFETLLKIASFFDVSIDRLLDYNTAQNQTFREKEILSVFRLLTPEQQDICIEQCRVFTKFNR